MTQRGRQFGPRQVHTKAGTGTKVERKVIVRAPPFEIDSIGRLVVVWIAIGGDQRYQNHRTFGKVCFAKPGIARDSTRPELDTSVEPEDFLNEAIHRRSPAILNAPPHSVVRQQHVKSAADRVGRGVDPREQQTAARIERIELVPVIEYTVPARPQPTDEIGSCPVASGLNKRCQDGVELVAGANGGIGDPLSLGRRLSLQLLRIGDAGKCSDIVIELLDPVERDKIAVRKIQKFSEHPQRYTLGELVHEIKLLLSVKAIYEVYDPLIYDAAISLDGGGRQQIYKPPFVESPVLIAGQEHH